LKQPPFIKRLIQPFDKFLELYTELLQVWSCQNSVDRAYKINSSFIGFHEILLKIKGDFQKNGFPLTFIDRQVKRYLDKKQSSKTTEDSPTVEPKFYKLPFIGRYSNTVQKRIYKIVNVVLKMLIFVLFSGPLKLVVVLFLKTELRPHSSLLLCTNFNVPAV